MGTRLFSFFPGLLSVIYIFISSVALGQDPYFQKANRKIRQQAIAITRNYQPGLVMGSEQAMMFKEKVAEFLIRKQAVENTNFSPKKKYFYLKRLYHQESAEMVDILEPYKWQEYVRMKKIIQPLYPPPRELREDAIVHFDSIE